MEAQRQAIGQGKYGIDIIVGSDELSSKAKKDFEYQIDNDAFSEMTQSSDSSDESSDTNQVTKSASFVSESPKAGECHFMIPEDALATYKQLLGTSSDRETIQYLMYIRENGEPTPQSDGTNAWTSAYDELESKLMLRESSRIVAETEQKQNELQDIDTSTEEGKSKLESKTDEVANEAVKTTRRVARAKANASASLLSNGNSELTGIDKTRSMLGLPSRNISKMAKVRLMRAASANALAVEDSSEVQSDDTFYDISDDILSQFDKDNVSEANEQFLDSLKPRW